MYQYFCGMRGIHSVCSICLFELVNFRKLIGEAGIELIFQESIRVNNENDEGHHYDTVSIDSTVQEKNITYHTDAKLHKKIVKKVLGIVKKLGLPLRQSYTFVLKAICREQSFWNHPKNRKKAIRANRRLRTIARRLLRELKRNLKDNHNYDKLLELFETVLFQSWNSQRKIYSLMNRKYNVSAKAKNIRNTN